MLSGKVNILICHRKYLVINKPPGIHSVSLPNSQEQHSIAAWIKEKYPECESVSPNKHESGLCNRLDFDTSGLLIAARHTEYWEFIRNLYRKKNIRKTYYALVDGILENEQNIGSYIGTPYRRAKKVKIYLSDNNAPKRSTYAESTFTPLSHDIKTATTLVKVETVTGARHQVRVHAMGIGHPLTGDLLYRSSKSLTMSHTDYPISFILHSQKVFIDGLHIPEAPVPHLSKSILERFGHKLHPEMIFLS